MPQKYTYEEGMSAEDKRKYRRQQRALAAKENGEGQEGTPKPVAGEKSSRRSKSTAAKGGVVVEAPDAVEDEEEGDSEDSEEGLLRPFITRGIQHNPKLQLGYGFLMKGFAGKNLEERAEVAINKFFARWGHEPTVIRRLSGQVVIMGPLN